MLKGAEMAKRLNLSRSGVVFVARLVSVVNPGHGNIQTDMASQRHMPLPYRNITPTQFQTSETEEQLARITKNILHTSWTDSLVQVKQVTRVIPSVGRAGVQHAVMLRCAQISKQA